MKTENKLDNPQMEAEIVGFSLNVAEDLAQMLREVYRKLIPEEQAEFSNQGKCPARLLKTILLAAGPQRLDTQWNAETIKPQVKKLKRILNRRV